MCLYHMDIRMAVPREFILAPQIQELVVWETVVLQVTSWAQPEQCPCVSGAEVLATPESHHYLSMLLPFLIFSFSASSHTLSCWPLLCSSYAGLCVRYAMAGFIFLRWVSSVCNYADVSSGTVSHLSPRNTAHHVQSILLIG